MSSVLYQTFYPYNKFDDGQTICKLEKWMLSKTILSCISRNNHSIHVDMNTPLPEKTCVARKAQMTQNSQFIVPDKMDTLFWCLYISYYGEEKYLAIGNKYGNAEISEKQKIMETLKSNKNALKNLNRKITICSAQEIMSDLMTNMKTSLLSLVAFAVYYKKNILLLNTINKTFLEYRYDDRTILTTETTEELGPWLIIKYTEKKKYGFYSTEREDISDIKSEYTYIHSPDKPLKGISTYKMGELVEIASKIPELQEQTGINLSEDFRTISRETRMKTPKESKMSKPELYGKIWHSLLWS